MARKTREEWEALERAGKCPECGEPTPHLCLPLPTCRKWWFDYGFRIGYHDGANSMERHDDAYFVEMFECGEVFDTDG